MNKKNSNTPIHPGEILLEEFLKPLNISQYRLAKDIGVPPRRINEIVLGKRGITADTALRLGRYLGMSAEFWLNLQGRYALLMGAKKMAGKLVLIRELRKDEVDGALLAEAALARKIPKEDLIDI